MKNKDIYNIDRIKAVADCRDIARSLGYELNKQDRSKAEYRNGEDPNVYFTKEYFSDKTDKKFKGDVFAFVQVANNCSFEEALKYVADFYNIKQTNEKQSESKQNEPFPYHKYEKPVVYDFSDTDDTLVLFEQRQYLKQEHKFDLYNGKKLRKKLVSLGHYDESGEKIYSIKDCRRIIYNRKAVPDSDTVFINEGPKGAEITNKLDLVGTAVICGANISWRPEYNKDFKDKNVVIIQDNDEQGAGFAQEVAGSLYGTANSIKIIIVSSEPKGDIEQFVESGGTKEKLLQLVKDTPKFKLKFQQVKTEKNTTGEKKQTREDVPEDSINRPEPSVKNVLLPSAYTPYIKSAEGIFSSLKAKKNMYIRGGKVQEVTAGEIDYKLEIINSHSFKSRIEQLGTTVVYKKTRQNTLCLEVKRPSKEDCESLLATPQINILPKINNIFSNPIIIPDGNGTKFLTKGYNPENGGIFISGGEDISKVEFTEARQAIIDLLCDFEFVTPSDLSRMLGAIITPALRFGRFTDEKCPIISFEANKEQAGKGLPVA